MIVVRRLVVLLLLAGCSATVDLPERTDAVRAEERRLAAVIEADQRSGFTGQPGACDVRLLRQEGDTSWVWARCTYGEGGLSTAFRVRGPTVTAPRDGAGYADSIREVFPDDLAAMVLEHQDEVQP